MPTRFQTSVIKNFNHKLKTFPSVLGKYELVHQDRQQFLPQITQIRITTVEDAEEQNKTTTSIKKYLPLQICAFLPLL